MASIFLGTAKYEGLNGVNRQPSKGLKFNREQSKTIIFSRQPSKSRFQGISNLTILADLQRLLAPEEPLNRKNLFPCSQRHFLEIVSRTLQLAYIGKYFKISQVKGKDNIQTKHNS